MVTDQTQFTRDVMGRYVCNTFAEALASGPFDVIIIGGGTFGLTLAQDLHFLSLPTGTIKPDNSNYGFTTAFRNIRVTVL
jgi:hypothetical protein